MGSGVFVLETGPFLFFARSCGDWCVTLLCSPRSGDTSLPADQSSSRVPPSVFLCDTWSRYFVADDVLEIIERKQLFRDGDQQSSSY
jgi:hypothetical protein